MKYGVEAEKYILVANRYHKNIQFFSFVALAIALYHAHFLNIKTWIGIGILLSLTGLYALPILPHRKKLRNLGLLKIVLVALVWAGTTVLLPIISFGKEVLWDTEIETLQRFILVLILLIPFEIRDLKYDGPELKTLPQRYGVAHTKILGAIATVVFFFLTFLKDDIIKVEVISKGILALILGSLMFITKKKQSKYYASFWIEAIPIFWWGMVWILDKKV